MPPHPRPVPPGFPPSIKVVYDQLRNDMVNLSLKLSLFKDAFLTPENTEVLFRRSADAFNLIEQCVANDISISIARLMDKATSGAGPDKENLTLWYLFDLIKTHGKAPELLTTIEARYKSLETILCSISLLRRKVIAHRDRATALTTPLDLNLTTADILKVCDEFKGILNDIEGHFEHSKMMYGFVVSYAGIPNLVKHLKRGIEAVDEDFKKELAKNFPDVVGEQPYGEVQ